MAMALVAVAPPARAKDAPAPLAPQGTDLSGLWHFTDSYARAGEW